MKSTLRMDTLHLPFAEIGAENPLPDIGRAQDIHSQVVLDDSVPEVQRPYFSYGKVKSILPYRIQDGYTRNKQATDMPVVILENEYLTATFLPQYGGKLWSLYDRQAERDLIHENPVFQPANLALRNAWTSGGVEWNIGTTGHTPLTLSPLHTEFLTLDDGTPVLRMYEYERLRNVTYQMDFWLPEDEPQLMVRIRIVNVSDQEVPMYWWSNIAVDQYEGTRVLAPTDTAYGFSYGSRGIGLVDIPMKDGLDLSYPARGTHSMDWFFDIPEDHRPWEAAVHEDGYGLIHCSTTLLQGRKLFMWGEGPGGQRWQSFLAEEGRKYLEVQAGLAKTQMQHLPMPAGAVWEWLESYGPIALDPQDVHGAWNHAIETIDNRVDALLPQEILESRLLEVAPQLDTNGTSALKSGWTAKGSGWGALELIRCANSEGRFGSEAVTFTAETLDHDQDPWLTLLKEGQLPEGDPKAEPWQYIIQPEWRELLEASVTSGASDHWQGWLQLGIMYLAAGDVESARLAFETSDQRTANGWAKRNLAILLMQQDEPRAVDLLVEAYRLNPILPLAKEAGRALLKTGRYLDMITLLEGFNREAADAGRLQSLYAEALIKVGRLDEAEAILADPKLEIADLREGEVLLSDLWLDLQKQKNASDLEGVSDDDLKAMIPAHLDFRMKT